MKTYIQYISSAILVSVLLAGVPVVPFAHGESEGVRSIENKMSQSQDIIQFDNLVIQLVPSSIPGEMLVTKKATFRELSQKAIISSSNHKDNDDTRCKKYENISSLQYFLTECPSLGGGGTQPSSSSTPIDSTIIAPSGSYRVKITSETILMNRNRDRMGITDFAQGDQVNIFGYYTTTDRTIQALIVRNTSKPVERNFIQLNNAEVVSINSSSTTHGTTLVVIQRPFNTCNIFQGSKKSDSPCPLGIQSLSKENKNNISEQFIALLESARKYEITISPTTILLDRNRGIITLNQVSIGDTLNIYGSYIQENAQMILAEIIRDTSLPRTPTPTHSINGTITQINADGTFTLVIDGGRTVKVQNPFQVGKTIKLQGILNEIENIISQISQINFSN